MNTHKSHIVSFDFSKTGLVVFHSLLNTPYLVEFENEIDKNDFLNSLNNSQLETGFELLDKLSSITNNEAYKKLGKLQKSYLSKLPKRINFLSLLIAESCNLNCSYCITSVNIKSASYKKKGLMPFDIAQKSIDWYLDLPSMRSEHYINFSGGEPLLNRNVFINSVIYIKSKTHIDKPVKITLNTNSTLIDRNLAKFIAENNIEVATSLDGTPDINDMVRITKNGLPTSKAILKGWQLLRDNGCIISGFMATINKKNFSALNENIVDFAIEMNFKWIRITFDVIHLMDIPITEAIEKLWSVYIYGFKKGIHIEGFWSTSANNLLFKNRIPDDIGFFCGAVSGETISIHTDGRISTCGFSTDSFGNILNEEPFDYAKHYKFVSEYFPSNRLQCRGCIIEGSCAGGCHITRENSFREADNKAINFNCSVIKEMTKRILIHHFENSEGLVQKNNYSNSFGL